LLVTWSREPECDVIYIVTVLTDDVIVIDLLKTIDQLHIPRWRINIERLQLLQLKYIARSTQNSESKF